MADTGLGAALATDRATDEQCATIEITMSYLAAVDDGRVVCETSLRKRGHSVAFLESTITKDDRVVATATGSDSIFDRR